MCTTRLLPHTLRCWGIPLAVGVLLASSAASGQIALKHEWRFDEPSGSIAAPAIGQISGSLAPGATLGGGVVTLTGAAYPQSAVTFPASVMAFGYDDFSVEFSLRSSQTTSFGYPIEIMGNRTSIAEGNFFNVRGFVGGGIAVELYDDFGSAALVSSAQLFDDAWHTITVQREGSVLSLFIDGQLDAYDDQTQPVYLGDSSDLVFGNQYVSAIFPTAPFVGQLDNLRISTVPTPGAAAVLGLAGLLAARRRRTP